jgi:hypothetical protein
VPLCLHEPTVPPNPRGRAGTASLPPPPPTRTHTHGKTPIVPGCAAPNAPRSPRRYSAPGWDWAISGAGGDMALPGAVEYQNLHRDSGPPRRRLAA